MPTQKDIKAGWVKINGTKYNLVKMIDGGTGRVIWPTTQTYRYVIDSATLTMHYPSGANWLPASGGSANYCYATANVKKMQGETVVETISGATLRAASVSGTYSSEFTISASGIYGADLGTTEVNTGTAQNPQGYYCTASWVYVPQEGETSAAVTYPVYQQYNIAGSPVFDSADVTCTHNVPDLAPINDSATIYGYITRYFKRTWTSGHESTTSDSGGVINVYVNGSYSTSIYDSGSFVFSPSENQTLSSIDFDIEMAYASDTSYSDDVTVTQEAGYYTYATPVITDAYCEDVPAGGGTRYYVGSATQTYGWNGRTSGAGTNTPTVTFNPVSCTGYDLEDNETARTPIGTSIATCNGGGGLVATRNVTGYQEANTIDFHGYDEQKTYGQTYYNTREHTPSVSISADDFTSSGTACAASGGSCGLSCSASVMRSTQAVHPYTLVTTYHYQWTSGWPAPDNVVTTTGSDVDPWSSYVSTPVTPTISGGDTWLDHDDEEVTISSRGTTTGSARNATYTASYTALNGVTASDSVTLYQEANIKVEQVEHYRDIEITTTGTIPAAGGFFNLRYKSYYDHGSYKYTSGETSGTSQRDPDSATINLFNCSYNGDSEIQVNGSIAWAAISSVYVGPNSSSSTVTASVDIDGEKSDSITQDAASVTYTLELYSGATHVTDGYEFDWSGQQYIIRTLTLVDNGTNLGQYSFDKMPGSVADIGLNLRTGDIEVSGITRGMDDWFTVSEASSGESVTFWIKTNAL